MKTSSLKYLSVRSKVLRDDGSEVKVADLKSGDNILGSGEEVRTVISVFPFRSNNYRVIPRYKKSFILNEHQTVPVTIDGRVFLVNLPQFYNYANRSEFSLLHDDVDFEEKDITLEPYIIGCWLISNIFHRIQFSTQTKQIEHILNFINRFNISHINYGECIVINDVRIIEQFRKYNLFENPRIPDEFKFNSRNNRMKLFNGFSDYADNGNVTIFSENVMNDFCFLAHSLGFLTESRVIMKNLYLITYVYKNLVIVKNDFKVASVHDNESVCILLSPSNEIGILLSDFTVI